MNSSKDGGSFIELKKHVNAIHCSNNLSLVQRKLFNALLFKAYPSLPHKSRFQIQAKELCTLIGYNSNDYAKLKKALLGLITIAIEWNVIDCSTGTEKKWKASSILASAELADGICIYEYSHIMREFLYHPEIYGRVNIPLMAKFKSSYGLALYENCIRYQGLPQTPWFTLEVFRKLMGVMDSKYYAFKDFKKRVLNVAVKEVNTISPINVVAEIKRKNQKVTDIRFKLTKSDVSDTEKTKITKIDNDLYQMLYDTFSFSEEMIKQNIAEFGKDYVKEKVDMIINSESFQTGKIRGLTGYLLQALRKNYRPSKSSKKIIDDHRRKNKEAATVKQKEKEAREKHYGNYVNNKIKIYIKSLSKDEYIDLLADFEDYIDQNNHYLKKLYINHKMEHPAVRANFTDFLKTTKGHAVGEILSFDEFQHLIQEYSK